MLRQIWLYCMQLLRVIQLYAIQRLVVLFSFRNFVKNWSRQNDEQFLRKALLEYFGYVTYNMYQTRLYQKTANCVNLLYVQWILMHTVCTTIVHTVCISIRWSTTSSLLLNQKRSCLKLWRLWWRLQQIYHLKYIKSLLMVRRKTSKWFLNTALV